MPGTQSKREHAERAADVLVDSLRRTIAAAAIQGRSIAIDAAAVGQEADRVEAERALRFDVAGDLVIDGHLRVQNYGGNVYHISTQVADGEEQRWQTCIPELQAAPDTLQKHTGDVSWHVLSEVERAYGEDVIRRR